MRMHQKRHEYVKEDENKQEEVEETNISELDKNPLYGRVTCNACSTVFEKVIILDNVLFICKNGNQLTGDICPVCIHLNTEKTSRRVPSTLRYTCCYCNKNYTSARSPRLY
jgi:hypothetical protein